MLDHEEKKRIVEKRILRELVQYYSQHNAGMQMQILSAKYARALQDLIAFPEFVEMMRVKGIIRVEYSTNGARIVSPTHNAATLAVDNIQWY